MKMKIWAIRTAIFLPVGALFFALMSIHAFGQLPPTIEYACPPTFQVMQNGQANDSVTGKLRQWLCSDLNGRVFVHSGNPEITPESIILGFGDTIVTATIPWNWSGQNIVNYATTGTTLTLAPGLLDGQFNLIIAEPTAGPVVVNGNLDGNPSGTFTLAPGDSALVTFNKSTFHASIFKGGSSGGGTVTDVCMDGDGTVFASIVPGSCVTTAGTFAPGLVPANSGMALMGPALGDPNGVAFIQGFSASFSSGGSIPSATIAFPSSTHGGLHHTILVNAACSGHNQNFTSAAITDTQGNTYAATGAAGAQQQEYAATNIASGPDTLTINFTYGMAVSCDAMKVSIKELANTDGVVDVFASNSLEFSSGVFGATLTTTFPSEFINLTTVNEITTAPTVAGVNTTFNFDAPIQSDSTTGSGVFMDATAGAADSYGANVTTAGQHSFLLISAYEPSGVASTTGPPAYRLIRQTDIPFTSPGAPVDSFQGNCGGALCAIPSASFDPSSGLVTFGGSQFNISNSVLNVSYDSTGNITFFPGEDGGAGGFTVDTTDASGTGSINFVTGGTFSAESVNGASITDSNGSIMLQESNVSTGFILSTVGGTNEAVSANGWEVGNGGFSIDFNSTNSGYLTLGVTGLVMNSQEFINIGTCDFAGKIQSISDSATLVFNAIIVTGGGTGKGLAYCDGTNWLFH